MSMSLKGTVVRLATVSALTFGLFATAPSALAAPHSSPSHLSFVTTDGKLTKAEKAKIKRAKAIQQAEQRQERFVGRVLGAARSRTGARYVYGGTGPWAFDCSGFTRWVYNRVGKHLPRTSGAQAGATRRIARKDARPGDLVFFTSGGRVYHVGIFAGGNSLFHASRPGVPVGRGTIWTNQVFFGRVR